MTGSLDPHRQGRLARAGGPPYGKNVGWITLAGARRVRGSLDRLSLASRWLSSPRHVPAEHDCHAVAALPLPDQVERFLDEKQPRGARVASSLDEDGRRRAHAHCGPAPATHLTRVPLAGVHTALAWNQPSSEHRPNGAPGAGRRTGRWWRWRSSRCSWAWRSAAVCARTGSTRRSAGRGNDELRTHRQ